MWMASLTPIQVLLPIQLQDIDKQAQAAWRSAIVSGLGAVASVLATPIAGALSDRTTYAFSFFGLNGPPAPVDSARWPCSARSACSCSAHQQTVAGVAVLWVLFSAFQNGEYASLSAAIPDHVPVRQRATVAGWVGMPQALGLVVGTVLVVLVLGSKRRQRLLRHGRRCSSCSSIPFVFLTPDHPLDPAHVDPFSWKKLLRAYWISPREYPDFAWAWITRFLASLAIAMGTLYLLYFLRDQVQLYKHEHIPAATGLLILIVIYTMCVVLTAIVGGDHLRPHRQAEDDRHRVRGPHGPGGAAADVRGELGRAARGRGLLFGMGFGAYLAVDQALITQVLPAAADRAKDLGIINIAIVGPAAIGAAIAGPLVILGGYPTLFAGTAIVAALGSIFVWKIKSVPVRGTAARRSSRRAARSRPRPTLAICLLCATSRPEASQTSASSSNQPPLTCRARAATASGPGTAPRACARSAPRSAPSRWRPGRTPPAAARRRPAPARTGPGPGRRGAGSSRASPAGPTARPAASRSSPGPSAPRPGRRSPTCRPAPVVPRHLPRSTQSPIAGKPGGGPVHVSAAAAESAGCPPAWSGGQVPRRPSWSCPGRPCRPGPARRARWRRCRPCLSQVTWTSRARARRPGGSARWSRPGAAAATRPARHA